MQGPTAARVYLVRHGETERSARGAYSGRAEVALTDHGREQAEVAAERLKGSGVDAVVSSPLSRAVHTAEAIAAATGAPLTVDERLTEVDYGPLEGYDRHVARDVFGEPFAAWRADPMGSPLKGTEPLVDALERARSATAEAIAAHTAPVLVGHQGILRMVLVALGGIDGGDYFDTRFEEADPMEIEAPRISG